MKTGYKIVTTVFLCLTCVLGVLHLYPQLGGGRGTEVGGGGGVLAKVVDVEIVKGPWRQEMAVAQAGRASLVEVKDDRNAVNLIRNMTSYAATSEKTSTSSQARPIAGKQNGSTPASELPVRIVDAENLPFLLDPNQTRTKIPKIFHQTWDSFYVPRKFSDWIKSWTKNNPDWEYWFWTPDAVRLLINKTIPEFLSTYNSYDRDVFRANSMRYLIMYYVGGVYADLDLENLKNIDVWAQHYSCFASEDAHVHSYLVNSYSRSPMMITILGCRPLHPYYKLAIEQLPSYTQLKYNDKLVYADNVYKQYNASAASHSSPDQELELLHPDYFMGSYDSGWTGKVRSVCSDRKLPTLGPQQKQTCLDIIKRKYRNVPHVYAYANHHWVHVIMRPELYKSRATSVSIFDIVPGAKNVTELILKGKLELLKPFH